MGIRDFLFKNITDAEFDYIRNHWGKNIPEIIDEQEEEHFEKLICLFNNEMFILDYIDKNPFIMFYRMDPRFQRYQRFKNNGYLRSESIKPCTEELAMLFIETQKDIDKRKIVYDESKQLDPNILYMKLYQNLVNAVDMLILQPFKKIDAALDNIRVLEEDYRLNFITYILEPKFTTAKNLSWLDLRPSSAYFDSERLRKMHESLKSLVLLGLIKNTEMIEVDLMQRMVGILPSSTSTFIRLKNRIDQYHAIEKSNIKAVNMRRKALLEIAQQADYIIVTEAVLTKDQINTLQDISRQSKMKSQYLREVQHVPRRVEQRMFRLEHVEGIPLVVDKPDWFSDLDPAHREMTHSLFEDWETECLNWENTQHKDQKRPPNFWMWLESVNPVILMTLKIDKRYTVPKEEKLVTFTDGLCYNKKCSRQENGLIGDGCYIYNVDKNNDLYILPSPTPGVGKWAKILGDQGVKEKEINYNHNSVLNGENVKSAGCVYFRSGKIVQIDTNSGHYKPYMRDLKHAILQRLYGKQIFAEECIVTDYEGTHEVQLSDFIEKTFDIQQAFPHERERMSLDELNALKRETEEITAETKRKFEQNNREIIKSKTLNWAKSIKGGISQKSENRKQNVFNKK